MKKHVGLMALVVAILLGSITSGAFSKKRSITSNQEIYHWWDFNGNNQAQMNNPKKYSLDEDDSPDCPPRGGLIYCEIFASGEEEPDLATILNERMRF